MAPDQTQKLLNIRVLAIAHTGDEIEEKVSILFQIVDGSFDCDSAATILCLVNNALDAISDTIVAGRTSGTLYFTSVSRQERVSGVRNYLLP